MSKIFPVIGLTGPNAAGKGLAAKFFIEKGFEYFSLSDIVREEAIKSGLTTSREDLIVTGNKLRDDYGYSVLAERTFQKLKGKSVVDSFRHPAEVEFMRSNLPFFYLIGIDAPQKIRYERAMKRERKGDSIASFEEFVKKEEIENANGSAQQLNATLKLADEIVINGGAKEELNKKLEEVYNRILKMVEQGR